jgi:DNA-binding transcriptional LysR family regulator
MRTQDLRVFMQLAEAKSLHRAAQKCGLTQSAITKIVQRLESEFGVQLLDRSGRGIALTTAGTLLLQRAAVIQSAIGDTYAEMSAMRSSSEGLIRVGTATALLESAMLPVVARYVKQDAGVRFDLKMQVSSILLESLKDGHLDLVLCFSPEDIPDLLQSDDLGAQRYHLVGRQGHPLLALNGDIQALSQARWILPPAGNGMRDLVARYLAEQGAPPPTPAVETDVSTALLVSLVSQTDLITMLTEQMLHSHLGRGLAALPYQKAVFENRLRLFYRRNAYMPPVVQQFRTVIHQAFQSRDPS